ncbi:DoxX family protein [Roseicyclus sp. F158]|uniref:DoxX family protein n=1 Tax=Tropicimonas omnivorans TaxID=3075590 RepID=A0ABU3DGX2_9RHOB|nr:DoxX family protein [Roseicyclus sp. F158]MDT0682957.1 DoxX family protein [Roseicyclus sp. F158]
MLSLLIYTLAAFFVVIAVMNLASSASFRGRYALVGLPIWMHWVTGALELVTAALLIFPPTRFAGAALGFGVMLSATFTLIQHRMPLNAAFPAFISMALAIIAFTR